MADRQLTEQDLENMSPEEIMELQKQNCIFCHIVSGKIPVKKVHEDEQSIAFLDINPATKGHMLLIPKEHLMVLPQAKEELIRHLAIVSKKLSLASLRALQAQGTNIFVANGAIAGQRAPHAMIHIIPRYEGDGLTSFTLPEKSIPDAELSKLEQALRTKFGYRAQEAPRQEIRKQEMPKVEKEAVLPQPPKQKVKFITSSHAKRFHVEKCPFADKIPEASRIYLTESEALLERTPCECTGLSKKKVKEIDLHELQRMLQ